MTTPSLSDWSESPAPPWRWTGLRSGDHLDQPTFHDLYETAPEGFRAELIEGVVVVSSSVTADHGHSHGIVLTWLTIYHASTPGTESLGRPTILMGPWSEPQPDAALVVRPVHGGQSRIVDGFLAGPPELVVEVAYSSHSADLHSKYRDYERAGVREYVVLVLSPRGIEWYALRGGRFEPRSLEADGVFRSVVFPGLWLDSAALLAEDVAGVLRVLQLGLARPEHAAFVHELQARRAT